MIVRKARTRATSCDNAPKIRRDRRGLLATTSALALGVVVLTGSHALAEAVKPAQSGAPGAAQELAQATESHDFNIPAQSLAEALITFGQQANLQVAFEPSIAEGLTSSAVSGSYKAEDALRIMLTGLPLQHDFTGTSNVTISKLGQSSDGSVRLKKLTVEATEQTATGPVDGYVATRSASGTKTDTPLLETPRAISVVTADEIADRKVQSVEEALRYTVGVQVDAYGNDMRFDQIRSRGFNLVTTADFLDGMRQPNIGWLSYPHTEAYGLERLDVVKGPNSVLYGQVSPGGLVNRVTKRPTKEARHEVEIQRGTDEYAQGQFDLSGPVLARDDVQYRVVGVARDSESNIVGVVNNVKYFAPSISWQPTEKLEITLLGSAQEYETAGSPRPYQDASGKITTFWTGDEDFDKLKQQQYSGGYEAKYEINETFSLRQNLRYTDLNTINQYVGKTLQSDGYTFSRTAYGIYEDSQHITVDTSGQARFNTGAFEHTLIAGVDYLHIDGNVEYTYGSAPDLDMRYPDYDQDIARPTNQITWQNTEAHQIGFYAQNQIAYENWRLNLGLRHDEAETTKNNLLTDTKTSQEDGATTGSAGLLYLFDNGFAPYVSYSTSFIPELGTNKAGAYLDPTEGEQVEFGLKYQPPGSRSLFTISAFNLVQKNAKTSDPDDPTNTIQTGEVRSRGIELEGKTEIVEGLELVANYSYTDMEITKNNDGNEGNVPVGVPEHLASVWGNYSFTDPTFDGLELGFGARYTGENYADSANNVKNDAYLLFDARISYSLDRFAPGATFAVNGTNLGDEDQVMCESGYCYIGRGRTVIASLNYRW